MPEVLKSDDLNLVELRESAEWLLDFRQFGLADGEKLRHRRGLLWNVPGFSPQVVLELLDRIEGLENVD